MRNYDYTKDRHVKMAALLKEEGVPLEKLVLRLVKFDKEYTFDAPNILHAEGSHTCTSGRPSSRVEMNWVDFLAADWDLCTNCELYVHHTNRTTLLHLFIAIDAFSEMRDTAQKVLDAGDKITINDLHKLEHQLIMALWAAEKPLPRPIVPVVKRYLAPVLEFLNWQLPPYALAAAARYANMRLHSATQLAPDHRPLVPLDESGPWSLFFLEPSSRFALYDRSSLEEFYSVYLGRVSVDKVSAGSGFLRRILRRQYPSPNGRLFLLPGEPEIWAKAFAGEAFAIRLPGKPEAKELETLWALTSGEVADAAELTELYKAACNLEAW